MKKILSFLLILLFLQGCSIHYHNEKSLSGNATKIKTKFGQIKNAKAYFKSTLDIVLGSIIKKEPIPPPSELKFMDSE